MEADQTLKWPSLNMALEQTVLYQLVTEGISASLIHLRHPGGTSGKGSHQCRRLKKCWFDQVEDPLEKGL